MRFCRNGLIFWTLILWPFWTIAQTAREILPVEHRLPITSINFNRNGQFIVSSEYNKTIVWDSHSGKVLSQLFEDSNKDFDNYSRSEFSKDGSKIVTSSSDGFSTIWNAVTGEKLFDLTNNDDIERFAAHFSPDGRHIAVLSASLTAYIYNGLTGKEEFKFDLYSDRDKGEELNFQNYFETSFSNDGSNFITVTSEGIRVYSVAKGVLRSQYTFDEDRTNSICLSPPLTANYVCVNKSDEELCFYDLRGKGIIKNFKRPKWKINDARFSRDGRHLLIIYTNGYISVYDLQVGGPSDDWFFGNTTVHAVFSQDGKHVEAIGENGISKIWNLQTHKERSLPPLGTFDIVAFSEDAKQIAIVRNQRQIQVIDYESNRVLSQSGDHVFNWDTVDFSNDGKFAFLSSGKNCRVLEILSGNTIGNIRLDAKANFNAETLKISPDNQKLISFDETALMIFDIKSSQLLMDKSTQNKILNVDIDADSKKIILTYTDSIYNIRKVVYSIPNALENVTQKSSPAANELNLDILASANPDIKPYSTIENRNKSKFPDIKNVDYIDYSRDLKYLIHSDSVNNVRFINTSTGIVEFGLSLDSTASLINIVTSRDGTLSAFITKPRNPDAPLNIAIWNIKANREISKIQDFNYRFEVKVEFNPDGRYLLIKDYSGGNEHYQLWDVSTGKRASTNFNNKISNTPLAKFIDANRVAIYNKKNSSIDVWDYTKDHLLYAINPIDSSDFVVFDAFGRFDGTQNGMKLIYYNCDNEIIDLAQLKQKLWVSGLIKQITNGDIAKATALTDTDINICNYLPRVESVSETKGIYKFTIIPRLGKLGKTMLSVNGNVVKTYNLNQLTPVKNGYQLIVSKKSLVKFFASNLDNLVSVRAYNADNDLSSRDIGIINSNVNSLPPPNLYAIMIGINDYKDPSLHLSYPAKDANALSRIISLSSKKLLDVDNQEHVFTYNITTESGHYAYPYKKAIKDVLLEIGKKSKANDILLIFFAGHGLTDTKTHKFYFLTAEATESAILNSTLIRDVSITTDELMDWIHPDINLSQKRILIFDSCNSGGSIADIIGASTNLVAIARSRDAGMTADQLKAIDNLNRQAGLYILAASSSDQSAYEMSTYQHGVLTYSLLQSIKEDSKILNDQFLWINNWFSASASIASAIVNKEFNGKVRQDPKMIVNNNIQIGIVDTVIRNSVVLTNQKAVIAQSNFRNQISGIDDMNIGNVMDDLLRTKSKEDNFPFNFNPCDIGSDSYMFYGNYKILENVMTIKIELFEKSKKVLTLYKTGPKDKFRELLADMCTKLRLPGN
jgi:WD40 repeat protein